MSFESVVFPGQGAQKRGMASDFYETCDAAKAVFTLAQNHLTFDVKAMSFEDNEDLHQTLYTQPCIITAEVAMFRSLQKTYEHFKPAFFAGHSLGEYAALVAAGVLSFEIAIQLVAKRGQLMNNASIEGAMAAVIMDNLPLETIMNEASAFAIDVANDNSINQVVLSGEKKALLALIAQLEERYKAQEIRCVMLNVSAPFHSRHMKDIEDEFFDFLMGYEADFNVSHAVSVASNYLGRFYQADSNEIITALSKQLSGTVKWRDNMSAIINKTSHILELGPNRPLRGFFKTLDVDIISVINQRSANKAFA